MDIVRCISNVWLSDCYSHHLLSGLSLHCTFWGIIRIKFVLYIWGTERHRKPRFKYKFVSACILYFIRQTEFPSHRLHTSGLLYLVYLRNLNKLRCIFLGIKHRILLHISQYQKSNQ